MNSFKKVVEQIRECFPDVKHEICFTIKEHPAHMIKVSSPNPFDNYIDVIARVTLFYNNKTILDGLVTINTDLDRFVQKLKKKIITNEIERGSKKI